MMEEIGVWRLIKLTEEKKDCIGVDCLQEACDDKEERNWLVSKLLTQRPFNKDALLGTMRIIWRLSRDAEVVIMDKNLFFIQWEWDDDNVQGVLIKSWVNVMFERLKDEQLSQAACTLWSIWNGRNNEIHGEPRKPTQISADFVKQYLQEFNNAQTIDSNVQQQWKFHQH